MQVQKVETSSIIVDEKIQQREQLNENYIDELSIEITEGAVLPPLDVYDIDGDLLLTDGFHRLKAFIRAGIDTVEVNIYKGNERDAVLHAVGANANHGLRRTNADKRKAVLTLLKDPEWQQWSDTEIARRIVVTQPFVSKVRRELTQNGFECDTVRRGADGRFIETANIGAKPHTEESEDSQAMEEGGTPRLVVVTTNTDENEAPHSSEGNDVESSIDSGSEVFADLAATNNDDEGRSDGGADESKSISSEDLSAEVENSADSDTGDEPEADDESSDQIEESDDKSNNDDDEGADESPSTLSAEEDLIPDSSSKEQTARVKDKDPETEIRDDSSSEEATDAAGEDSNSVDSEADESQSSSNDLPPIYRVVTLQAKIAVLENIIAEKDQHIEKLEAKNAELQRIIQEFEAQQMPSDDHVDSIKDFEPAENLLN